MAPNGSLSHLESILRPVNNDPLPGHGHLEIAPFSIRLRHALTQSASPAYLPRSAMDWHNLPAQDMDKAANDSNFSPVTQ